VRGWKINNIVTELWIYKLEKWYFIIIMRKPARTFERI
jgi:hypothetical protein